jgi:exfoliative toxin A/B
MKNIIKKVPLPICGVMLGAAALGNLLQSYSEGIRYFCGVMAAILLVLFLLKLIIFPNMFKEDMQNPITASVFATFPMAIMLLSTYVKPFIGQAAFIIWLAAIILHIILIIYFTVKFMLKPQMPKVFASYFIVYVGIAVAAVTAPVYEQTGIGTVAFWFGLIAFVLLFVLITVRYVKYKEIPEPARPLICIYTAPLSLCIAGYVQSVTPKAFPFLAAMLIVATLLYIFALIKAVGYLRLPFYPSYAAFTFPFVISAIAAKQAMACAAKLGTPIAPLSILVTIETVIAVVLVVYTYIRFICFILKK